jgi:hypothetical protein
MIASLLKKDLVNKYDFEDNVIYIILENTYIEIEGLKIFGSPYTPEFGNWSFMKS